METIAGRVELGVVRTACQHGFPLAYPLAIKWLRDYVQRNKSVHFQVMVYFQENMFPKTYPTRKGLQKYTALLKYFWGRKEILYCLMFEPSRKLPIVHVDVWGFIYFALHAIEDCLSISCRHCQPIFHFCMHHLHLGTMPKQNKTSLHFLFGEFYPSYVTRKVIVPEWGTGRYVVYDTYPKLSCFLQAINFQ